MRRVRSVIAVVSMAAMVSVVLIRILVIALRAMEHQKVHAEGIKSGDEYPGQHGETGKTSGR